MICILLSRTYFPSITIFPLVILLSKKLKLILKTAFEFSRNHLKILSAFLIFAFKSVISLNDIFFSILQYSNFRESDGEKDFSTCFCPIFKINQKEIATVNLILFSDGVNLKKSTFKKEVWPICIQIADLPPRQRLARKNIVLAALHVGCSHPNWENLVPHIEAELISGLQIEINENLNIRVQFKVRLLIAD